MVTDISTDRQIFGFRMKQFLDPKDEGSRTARCVGNHLPLTLQLPRGNGSSGAPLWEPRILCHFCSAEDSCHIHSSNRTGSNQFFFCLPPCFVRLTYVLPYSSAVSIGNDHWLLIFFFSVEAAGTSKTWAIQSASTRCHHCTTVADLA
jgi:hypothetical protein